MKSCIAIGVIVVGLLIAQRPDGGGWLVGALAVAALLTAGGRLAIGGHLHGGPRSVVARHEAGHVVAARAVGGRVKSAQVYGNGGGLVRWTGIHGSEREQVVANIAFLRAGAYAAGTREGCSGDDASVRQMLKYLPPAERSAALREGEAQGRRIVASRQGEIARVADRLDEKGRL
jgi:Peptidase M50B-like